MTRHYSTRDFFRQMPNALLARYFQARGEFVSDAGRAMEEAPTGRPATATDPRYTPSNARREARKLETQAMYQRWQKAYHDLKKQRRSMSDVWYSQQIAKREIAEGRSADTIGKHMKKEKVGRNFFAQPNAS